MDTINSRIVMFSRLKNYSYKEFMKNRLEMAMVVRKLA